MKVTVILLLEVLIVSLAYRLAKAIQKAQDKYIEENFPEFFN